MLKKSALYLLLRIIMAVLVCALAIYLSQLAWHSAQAFDLHHRVHVSTEQWLNGKDKPTLKGWERSEAKMLIAIEFQPLNAAFVNSLGRLYLYRGLSLEKHPVARALNILKAKSRFESAIKLRPAWVYPWVNMAVANAAIGQWEEQFLHAYQMAMKLGRWEENTMPILIELGLKSYEHFSPKMQNSYQQFLSTAMHNRSQHLTWLVQDKGLYQKACHLVGKEGSDENDFCP